MVEVDDGTIEEIVHRGESMRVRDLVDVIERRHAGGPGVPRETLAAYVRALADRRDYVLDAEGFLGEVDDRTTAEESWIGPDRFYAVGEDRLSQYPARWHEALGDETDAAAYVRFIAGEAPGFVDDLHEGGAGEGITKDVLIDVMQVIAGLDRDEAAGAITAARDRDVLAEDADQHPQARVYLTDDGGAAGDDR